MSEFDYAVSGYRIIHLIIDAGDTALFRAVRESDGLSVIFKIYKPQHSDTATWNRQKQEYEILDRLKDTEGVIRTYGIEIFREYAVLILEHINGGESLKRIMDQRRQTDQPVFLLDEFFDISIQSAKALAGIHAAKIIHKDINPDNILYNPGKKILKIIGFHFATTLTKEFAGIKSSGKLEGTLQYISPEQTGRVNRIVDYRSDLYALGATFYELLTGRPPFDSDDPVHLIHAHIAKIPQPVIILNPAIPPVISDIIIKLLSKNAEERYQSAQSLLEDLEHCRSAFNRINKSGKHTVPKFELGRQDNTGHFHIQQKLYGRKKDTEKLKRILNSAVSGNIETVLLTGPTGTGKTIFALDIKKSIAERHGYFINGKFEHQERNTPYLAFSEALNQFADILLTESDPVLRIWRDQILNAVGGNGAILTEIIPNLKKIIGVQPAIPDLNGQESINRLKLTFQYFIQSICSKEHPLVIFIDNLQWADIASLDLLNAIVTNEDINYLLLITAFQTNDSDKDMMLINIAGKLSASENKLHTIELNNLKRTDIHELIMESLSCTYDESTILTGLVLKKTHGNPYFIHQLLLKIIEEGSLFYSSESGHWKWDAERINSQNVSDDGVELISGSLKKFSGEITKFLQPAACIGMEFTLRILLSATRTDKEKVPDLLQMAVADNIIIPLDELYNPPEISEQARFRFLHNRTQKSIYNNIPENERKKFHLEIARSILDNKNYSVDNEKQIYDIVRHYNLATDYITVKNERTRVIELNIQAADIAYRSAAFHSAKNYLEKALSMLPEDSWISYYDTMLKIHLRLALIFAYLEDTIHLDQIIKTTENHVHSVMDKALICHAKINVSIAHGNNIETAKTGLSLIEELGVSFPTSPSVEEAYNYFFETAEMFTDEKIKSIPNLPEAPAETGIIYETAALINGSIYSTNINLYLIFVSKTARLCLEQGLSVWAISRLISFEEQLVSLLHDIPKAHLLTNILSSTVKDRYPMFNSLPHMNFALGTFIMHRYEHLMKTLPVFEEGIEKGLRTGYFNHSAACAATYVFHFLFSGRPLDSVENNIMQTDEIHKKIQMEYSNDLLIYQTVLNLQGKSRTPWILETNKYDEEKILTEAIQSNNFSSATRILFFKSWLSFLFGRQQQAVELFRKTEIYLQSGTGSYLIPLFYFYDTLANSALNNNKNTDKQFSAIERINRNLKEFDNYVRYAPMNHQHKKDLMEAELARLKGRFDEAAELYEKAINGALINDFTNELALSYELASEFYLKRGLEEVASLYMIKAHASYQRWQALAKVQDIERKYSKWFKTKTFIETKRISEKSEDAGIIDARSIIKASQLISSQIILEELLAKLMEIVIENAGAQRGCILLEKEGEWIVEAESPDSLSELIKADNLTNNKSISSKKVTHGEKSYSPEDDTFSHQIVRYVVRTLESIVLDNASTEDLFAGDQYIKTNRIKSLICLPLINMGRLTGILYLENNLATGVFTRERIETLEILAGQAAIAIENAVLYKQAQQEIEERKTMQEALKESKEWFEAIFNSVNDAIIVHDAATSKIVDANPVACQLFGYTRKELLNLHGKELHTDESEFSLEKGLENINKTFTEGPQLYEWKMKDKSGRVFWAEVNMRKATMGGLDKIIVATRDISSRKQIEDDLRESEERFRRTAEQSLVGIYLIQDNVFKYVNARFAEIHGYEAEEMIDRMSPPETIHPEDKQKITENARLRDLGKPAIQHENFRVITKQNEVKYVELWSNSVLLKGKPTLIGTMIDITERKLAEEKLLQSEEKYRLLVESTVDWVWEADTNEIYTYSSPQVRNILGYEPEEIIGKRHYDFMCKDDESEQIGLLLLEITSKQLPIVRLENKVLNKDGKIVVLESNGVPFFNADGILLGYRGIDRDITDRKKAEQALKESEERFRMFMDHFPGLAYIKDKNTSVIFANQGFSKYLNIDPSEMTGKTNSELFPAEFAEKMTKDDQLVYASGQSHVIEEHYSDRTWSTYKFTIPHQGHPPLLGGFTLDITDRKKIELQLERGLRETKIRYEVSHVLAGTETEEEVLDALIKQAGIYPQALVGISTFDNSGSENIVTLRRQDTLESGLIAGRQPGSTVIDSTFASISLLSPDKSFISNDFQSDTRFNQQNIDKSFPDGVMSLGGFPLSIDNEWIGYIGVMSREKDFFDDEKQHLYQTIAEQGAIALRAALFRKKIRESQQRLSLLIQQSPMGIIEWNNERKILLWNPAAERIFGYTKEQAINQRGHFITPEQNLPEASHLWTETINYKSGFHGEYVNKTSDGRIITCEWLNNVLIGPDGEVAGMVSFIQDVTERKRLETQIEHNLKETTVRYELSRLLSGAETEEQVLDVLIRQSELYPDAQVIICTFETIGNERFSVIRRQNTFSSGLPELKTGGRLPVSDYTSLNTFRTDQVFISNNTYADDRLDPESKRIYSSSGISSTASFPFATGDEWTGYISVMSGKPDFFNDDKQHLYQSLAEQGSIALRAVRLREKIRESQQRLSLLIKQSPLGIIEWDMNNKIISWNPAAEQIFSYTSEQALNQQGNIITPEQNQTDARKMWDDMLENKSGFYGEYKNKTKDGRIITCEWLSTVLIDMEGNSIGVVSFVQDVSERNRLRAKLEHNLEETRVRYEVSQLLARAETEDEVLDIMIRHLGVYPEAQVTICTYDTSGNNQLDVILRRQDVFKSGLTATIETGTRLPSSVFSTAGKYHPGRTFVSNNVNTEKGLDPATLEVFSRSGIVSMATFGLSVGDEHIGFIGVHSRLLSYFDEEKQHLYQTLAEQGAVALRAARLREKIRDSQQRLSLIVQQSSLGVIEYDLEFRVASWNPAAEQIFGYTSDEAYKQYASFIVPEYAHHLVEQLWQNTLARTGKINGEYENITKDGRIIICEWFNSPLVNSEGKIIGVVSLVQDVTKRKLAEEELRAKTEELDRYFTSSLDLLCIADTDGYFHRLNPEWEKTLGYTIAELEGTKFLDLIHPDDLENTLSVITDLNKQKQVMNFENRYRRKDGSYRWIEWRSYPVDKMIYAVARDITERKHAEEELAKHRDHLEELVKERTRELEAAQEELIKKERLSVLGQLTATVSHELRNPLGVIRSSAFYLKEKIKNADDKIRKHMDRIEFQVDLCNWIVEELLEYTRGSNPEMTLGDIASCIKNTLDDVQGIEDIMITQNISDILPNIFFDQTKIRRVITNLVTNAAHAVRQVADNKKNKSGINYIPEIRINADFVKDYIEIVIEDNGTGMDEATIKKAFDPLFTTKARGTGLGLSIVKKIMEEHNGIIELDSRLNTGTKIILKLPVKPETE